MLKLVERNDCSTPTIRLCQSPRNPKLSNVLSAHADIEPQASVRKHTSHSWFLSAIRLLPNHLLQALCQPRILRKDKHSTHVIPEAIRPNKLLRPFLS